MTGWQSARRLAFGSCAKQRSELRTAARSPKHQHPSELRTAARSPKHHFIFRTAVLTAIGATAGCGSHVIVGEQAADGEAASSRSDAAVVPDNTAPDTAVALDAAVAPVPSPLPCDPPGSFFSVASARINAFSFSPDRSLMALGLEGDQGASLTQSGATPPASNLLLCRIADGTCTPVPGHARATWAVQFSPDGSLLASGGGDTDVGAHVVRVSDGTLVQALPTLQGWQSSSGVMSTSFSHDGKTLAVAGNLGAILLWRVSDFARTSSIPEGAATMHMVFSHDDTRLLAARETSLGSATMYRVSDSAVLSTFEHGDEVFDAEFSPEETEIATVGNDGTLKLWDTGGTLRQQVTVSRDIVSRAVWIDGNRIVTSDWLGGIKLWSRGADGAFEYACEWSAQGQALDLAVSADSADGTQVSAAGRTGSGESLAHGIWTWKL